eukprot:CCRYP_011111-RA/>CCRYP_011111-RA protein AED:0.45 eAED:0.56 QI:0/0/0/1/0/0/2/0/108
MVRKSLSALPVDGKCAVNGRTAKLLDLKESHPLQVAEFAFAAQIADEPAFNWWVNWVLKKRDRIISLVKRRSARYHKRLTNTGLTFPSLLRRHTPSTRPQVLPFGTMQ